MDLSDDDLEQRAAADRREVNPPVQVETATGPELASSIGGSKSVSSGSAGYEARTAGNGGSEPLIFPPRAAHSHDLGTPPSQARYH
jgi:hypothetical protein